jgi:hypothetical protein
VTAIYLVGALLTAVAIPLLFARRYPGNRSLLWVGILAGLVGMLMWPVTLWLALAVWFLGFAEPRQDASIATRLPRKIVLPVSAVGLLATLVAFGATAEPVAASSSEPARLVTSAPRPTPTLVVPSTTATTASTSLTTPPASTTPPPAQAATARPTPGPAPKPLIKPAPKPQRQQAPTGTPAQGAAGTTAETSAKDDDEGVGRGGVLRKLCRRDSCWQGPDPPWRPWISSSA